MHRPFVVLAIILFTSSLTPTANAIVARDYRQTFWSHASETQACFMNQRRSRGSVELVIDIGGDGRIQTASVENPRPANMRGVGECIVQKARTWLFDRSTGGSTRRYRFTFNRRAEAPTVDFLPLQ